MIKKINITIFIMLILIMMFSLTSCRHIHPMSQSAITANEDKIAEKQEKLLIDALNTRDVTSIKKLFSKNALSKISNIDEKLDEFLEYYSGKYISSDYSYSVEDYYDYGDHTKSFHYGIGITTDKDVYTVACTDVISHPKHSQDLGINQLDIIHAADANSSAEWHENQDNVEVKCFY